jgi:hypothetical protein
VCVRSLWRGGGYFSLWFTTDWPPRSDVLAVILGEAAAPARYPSHTYTPLRVNYTGDSGTIYYYWSGMHSYSDFRPSGMADTPNRYERYYFIITHRLSNTCRYIIYPMITIYIIGYVFTHYCNVICKCVDLTCPTCDPIVCLLYVFPKWLKINNYL